MTVNISDLAAFVQKDYRVSTQQDTTVQIAQSSAQTLTIVTNLDKAGGDALAATLLADYKRSTLLYQVDVEGCDSFSLDSFNGEPPMVQMNLPGFASRQMRAQSITVDFGARTTTLKARG